MKTEVDNYRGFEIRFDTENETFECDIDDSRSVKKSYPAIKGFIDQYIKDNSEFKPFKVEEVPSYFNRKDGILTVVGVRKDGKFIIEKNSKKEIVSDYNLGDYMLYNAENKSLWDKLNDLEQQRSALTKIEKEIISQFKVITLKSVKSNYLPK